MSGPYYEYDLRLRSRPAQHIARRYLRVVSHAAHVIGIMMSEADGEADDDGAGEWVDAIIAEAAQEMMAMLAPWRALAQQHAIGIAEGQEPPMTMTVEVSTPHLMAYIGLLGILDESGMDGGCARGGRSGDSR